MCGYNKVSPVVLAEKWKCSASSIRKWIHQSGKQLPKRYRSNYNYQDDEDYISETKNEMKDISSDEEDDTIAKRLRKRKNLDPSRNIARQILNSARLILDSKIQQPVLADLIQNSKKRRSNTSSSPITTTLGNKDANDNIICISEDDDMIVCDNESSSAKYNTDEADNDHTSITSNRKSDDSDNSASSVDTDEEEISRLSSGKYSIACIHLEFFRSSKHSFQKLTQIGCVVSDSNPDLFFKAMKPSGIETYLDTYRIGGDLLQALHMTREEDGTFLFRSRFEDPEETDDVVCISEEEALKSFFGFLQKFSGCVILGVDEETVSILLKKLRNVVKCDISDVVKGFTHWRRVLKHIDVAGYNNLDLEEFYTHLVGKDLPSFNTALDISSVLLKSVQEVHKRKKGDIKSSDSSFYNLCKKIEFLSPPKKGVSETKNRVENVEVFSSFRPSVCATFSAEKLEQIVLSSDSDSQPEEPRKPKNQVQGASEYTAPEMNNRNVEMNDYVTENRGQVNNNNGKRLQNYVNKEVDLNASFTEFDTSTELMMRAPVKTAPLRIRSFPKPTRKQVVPAIGSFSQVRPRQPGQLRQARLLGPKPRYFRPIQPRPCQSQIRMNSQYTQTVFKPLVIKLDSPDRKVSEVVTHSAKGCSEGAGRHYNPKIMPDVTLLSGIKITRTPSRSEEDHSVDKTNVATLKSLARALECLGETQGVKRLVTYHLSEPQVQGLRILGLNEHERIF